MNERLLERVKRLWGQPVSSPLLTEARGDTMTSERCHPLIITLSPDALEGNPEIILVCGDRVFRAVEEKR